MIDIHSHILPGIDDGAKDLEGSIEMARKAVQEGIHTIIATPHHKNEKFENPKQDILPLVEQLNRRLQEENINLNILPGQEVRIFGELLEDYEKGTILPLASSSYLFIEFPSDSVPRYTEKLIYDIQLTGFQPIIVHPERNAELMERPEKLYRLVKNGAATQLTAASIAGYFGKNIQKFTGQIIEANLAHFIASDAHNITTRAFKMKEAYDFIEKKYGSQMVYYFMENAELLIDQKAIFKEIPQQVKKKKILGIF